MTETSAPRTRTDEHDEQGERGPVRAALDWWLADRTHTGPGPAPWVIGQWPNTPALVGGGLLVGRWLVPVPPVWLAMGVAGRGVMVWWGVGEVRSGVNPLRRVLGGGMIVAQLALLPTGL